MNGHPTSKPGRLLRCRDRILAFRRTPLVMGILNVTPDSFSDGGRFFDRAGAVRQANELARSGADILDIGGESTRPGSAFVDADTELERIMPVIETVLPHLDIPVSVDTRKAAVAAEALRHGCHLINDISAGSDPFMVEVLAEYGAPVVIMHMKGEPKTMQVNPVYQDVVGEVTEFLDERARTLTDGGIPADRIVIDPGLGFGKRFKDNLDLLKNIGKIRKLGYPVLVGGSRKRFIGEILQADVDHRLAGNLAVVAACCREGADIVRVHDVRETVGFIRTLDAMDHPGDYSADW
jgi:dihydropteroate synthase